MSLPPAVDLRNMIAAAGGVNVTIGGVTVKGLLRAPDSELLQGEPDLAGRAVSVLVVTEDLPAITAGMAVEIDGESMKVHRTMREGAVKVTRILAKVA
jgi:hypothetical protein